MPGARSLTITDFDPSSARFWIKYLSTLRAIDYNRPEFRMAGTRSLRELLQTIPQEMYNEIYDYTFTTTTDGIIHVNKQTRPPTIMQVNHSTRAKVAAQYYSNSFDFSKNSRHHPKLRQSWANGMGLERDGTQVSWENEDGLIGRWFASSVNPTYQYRFKESTPIDGDSCRIVVKVYGSALDDMRSRRTEMAFWPSRVWSVE